MVFVFLPETVRRTKVEMLTSDNESGQEIVHKAEKFRALQNLKTAFAPMVAMLGDPTILVITFYNTVIFCCLYFLVSIIYFLMASNTHFTHIYFLIIDTYNHRDIPEIIRLHFHSSRTLLSRFWFWPDVWLCEQWSLRRLRCQKAS